MWGSAFAIDDPLNQYLADMYGVAMGTRFVLLSLLCRLPRHIIYLNFGSHHEPMMRATPNEWGIFGEGPWNYTSNSENVYKYFVQGTERARPYESLFTLGMRGEGDRKSNPLYRRKKFYRSVD